MSVKIISAGAGSGKTYRLMQELIQFLSSGVQTTGIVATTFTKKAAAELKERVMMELLANGKRQEAAALNSALIGTVHNIGLRWMERFAFELGISPALKQIPDAEVQYCFSQAMAEVLTDELLEEISALAIKLSLRDDREPYVCNKDVMELVNAARAYGMNETDLEASKDRSLETLSELFGNSSNAPTLQADLLAAFGRARAEKPVEDTTKTTAEAIVAIELAFQKIKSNAALPWAEWVRIGKTADKVGKKSTAAFAELSDLARQVHQHPQLKADTLRFVALIFDLALQAMERYKNYKLQRGLVDLQDMEALQYELLSHPDIKATLSEALEVLLVDEFQDTNPMQLAIFLRLTQMAKTAIWVGDAKQSIYGFRGADPRLMAATLQALGGVLPENILTYSWRSRPDIVDFCNCIFTQAFAHIPPEQITLAPKVPNLDAQGVALHHWHFRSEAGKVKANQQAQVYAETVARIVNEKWLIRPKSGGALRPVLPGDIGVLCRSNALCMEVAAALSDLGIRAAVARTGLIVTSEASLVLAGLRFIYSKRDTLALAEWQTLSGTATPEAVFQARIAFLFAANEDAEWLSEAPFVQQLQLLSADKNNLSVSELQHRLMSELGIRRLVATWSEPAQRLENLERLQQLAFDYEEVCNKTNKAAGLGDYLLWLEAQNKLQTDKQSAGDDPMAVRVETYHKSKGLEYSVVVLANLNQKMRDKIWGLALETSAPIFNLQQPLAGLWLRFWQQPFGKQFQGTALAEAVAQSPFQHLATAAALAEEGRLLYVGMTRARDYLVLPTLEGLTPEWLNRVVHQGNAELHVLDANITDASPFMWQRKEIPLDVRNLDLGDPHLVTSLEAPESIPYFTPPQGVQQHPKLHFEPQSGAGFVAISMAEQLDVPVWDWPEQVAPALKKVLQALQLNTASIDRKLLLVRFLPSYVADSQLISIDVAAHNWQLAAQHQLHWTAFWPAYPIEIWENGQCYISNIDLLAIDAQQCLWATFIGTDLDAELSQKEALPVLTRALTVLRQQFPDRPLKGFLLLPLQGLGLVYCID